MSIQSILLPVAVQIALVFVLFGMMASRRIRAFREGLDPQSIALSGEGFPAEARQYANSFANQFEFPILFLIVVLFAILLHQAGWLFVVLEWIFVLSRIAQAYVAVTSNAVMIRARFFFGSVVSCALMWLLVFIGVFFGTVIG